MGAQLKKGFFYPQNFIKCSALSWENELNFLGWRVVKSFFFVIARTLKREKKSESGIT